MTTSTTPTAGARRSGLTRLGLGCLATALSAAVVWLVVIGVEEPSRTDVTITNPTGFYVDVRVGPEQGEGGLGVGTLAPRSTRTLKGIADQGDRWRFDFSYGGVEGASITIRRTEVATGTITVPDEVSVEFEDAGFRPWPATP
jgi:hypothetical protein